MKGFFKTIGLIFFLKKNRNILAVSKQLADFLNEVHSKQSPLSTKIIAQVNMSDSESPEYKDVVSLWASTGDADLIERTTSLKRQVDELKRLLDASIKDELTATEKMHAEVILKVFG